MKLQLLALTVVITAVAVVPVFPHDQPQVAGANPAAAVEPPPLLSVPPGYKYEPRGRRDPFVNPIPKPVREAEIPATRPPGLKGVLVAEAKLMGIVVSREPQMNKAVLQAPGNRTYFASRGDALFDGVVKEIQPDAVVFRLVTPARSGVGDPAIREVVRKIRPVAGENQ